MNRFEPLGLPELAFLLLTAVLTCACSQKTPSFKCTDPIGCVTVSPGQPIEIGVLQSLSGGVAPLGIEQVRGIQLAMDACHSTLLGHPIRLQTEDTGCTREGGANAALRIIADPQMVAILGTTCSSAAAAVSKAMSDAGLAMVSGNNSAPFLTSIGGKQAPDWHPGYFRTACNEETSGKAAAIYAFETLGVRKAATIDDGDIYTQGLTEGFAQAFRKLGGQIVLDATVNKGQVQMHPVLTAVLQSKARLLFFPLFQPEGDRVLLQARKLPGFKDIVLMSDGALIESSFIEAVKNQAKGMYFVGPAAPSGQSAANLTREYDARFRVAPTTSYYLYAYDSAMLLFQAIRKAAVRDAKGGLHIGRQALRNALYATRGFAGVTGPLTCDKFGDCARPVFNVLRLDDPRAGLSGLLSNVVFTYSPKK